VSVTGKGGIKKRATKDERWTAHATGGNDRDGEQSIKRSPNPFELEGHFPLESRLRSFARAKHQRKWAGVTTRVKEKGKSERTTILLGEKALPSDCLSVETQRKAGI